MHKNKYNNKVYIGATCMRPKARWSRGNGYKGNKTFYADIIEFGWDNFEHVILENNLNHKQSKEREMYYIGLYKDNIYNKTKGGEQGKIKHTTEEDLKRAFRESSKKYYYGNEEYRNNKIHQQMQKQKDNKEETNSYQKDYYYKNEKYHQYKIEYQRRYRVEHRKTNRPYNKKTKLELNLTHV